MFINLTPQEWTAEVGDQLRDIRLRKNINQQQLALQAGVALNAVKRIESGKDVNLTSLIRMLRALDHTDWLTTLSRNFGQPNSNAAGEEKKSTSFITEREHARIGRSRQSK